MHYTIPTVLQNLYLWDERSLSECEEIAHFIAAFLPHTFQFTRVEAYTVGIQQHQIALFEWRGTSQGTPCLFALIPGGTVTLGYDRNQRLVPSEELVCEWQEYNLEYHGDMVTIDGDLVKDILPANYKAFSTYLDNHSLPLRTVTLAPFLIETVAQEADRLLPPPLVTYFRHKSEWKKDGYLKYSVRGKHCSIPQRHVASFLKREGFRLPTSDEWEYACSAGSRTLFYWGNGYFTTEEPSAVPTSRNAFGLEIANDTYQWEYCSDPAMMRGGDGGVTVCGWAGVLASSLPLASAYYLRLNEKQINNGVYSPCFRRVLSLAPLLA
ncbi:SUMF1/EgtB/PvdO family nonheme iron enzyme [Ktedonobacter sp. SOSP1-85]|uniref:formylglycine-generating enzyme family protein n=1 Tax=Ktedonobacter sp. SOSP1-85 TaxID=2778367 RepID=UPI0019169C3F|nr:SUMF1/EgtB/PvdO family nonheme iron enzyme [Ktedonobacter sp. SOSP1-85]